MRSTPPWHSASTPITSACMIRNCFLSLRGLDVHLGPHLVCALTLDLEISVCYLVGDEEKPVLDVLAVLSSAHPAILCQQYGGLIILI